MNSPQRRLDFWRALEERDARRQLEQAPRPEAVQTVQEVQEVQDEQDDDRLRRELSDLLLQALRTGADAAHLLQRASGPELVRLGLLAPDVRFARAGEGRETASRP